MDFLEHLGSQKASEGAGTVGRGGLEWVITASRKEMEG